MLSFKNFAVLMQMQLEVNQKNDRPSYLMVMLHGYGSDGYDLISLAPYFQKDFPEIHFYSPNALQQCEVNSFGYQWFSLKDRKDDTVRDEILRNSDKIVKIIKEKLNELGLNENRLILLGFSQGAMASLFLALSNKISPAGVIAFSGRLIIPENFNNKLINFPICLVHGTDDDIVDYSSLIFADNFLKENHIKAEILTIEGLGHTIDLSGIEFTKNFIKSKITNQG
jgi:phospholipase/carboxylesterase